MIQPYAQLGEFLNSSPSTAAIIAALENRYASKFHGKGLKGWFSRKLFPGAAKIIFSKPIFKLDATYILAFAWACKAVEGIAEEKPIKHFFPGIAAADSDLMNGLVIRLTTDYLLEQQRKVGMPMYKNSYKFLDLSVYIYLFLDGTILDNTGVERLKKLTKMRQDIVELTDKHIHLARPTVAAMEVLGYLGFGKELGSALLARYYLATSTYSNYHIAQKYFWQYLSKAKSDNRIASDVATTKLKVQQLESEYKADKLQAQSILQRYAYFFDKKNRTAAELYTPQLVSDVYSVLESGHLQEICRVIDEYSLDKRIAKARFILQNLEILLTAIKDPQNPSDWQVEAMVEGANNLFSILADTYEFQLG